MIVAYFSGITKELTYENLKAHRETLKHFVGQYPLIAPFIFIVIYIISTALSLPGGSILSLIAGFIFPLPLSTLYVVVGATIGAMGIFLAAKTAFGEYLKKKAGPFLSKMEKGFRKNAWSYLLFLRFIPLFPFWLVNIAPAFFNVKWRTYLWTTFVGIIPGSYVYTQAGSGLGAIFDSGEAFNLDTIFNTQIQITLVLLALFSLFPIVVKRFMKK